MFEATFSDFNLFIYLSLYKVLCILVKKITIDRLFFTSATFKR